MEYKSRWVSIRDRLIMMYIRIAREDRGATEAKSHKREYRQLGQESWHCFVHFHFCLGCEFSHCIFASLLWVFVVVCP